MADMALLRRLALGEICLLQQLQEAYPYAVFEVDRISVGAHRWCILHMEKEVVTKFLVQTKAFSEAEESQICVGLLLSVNGTKQRWKSDM
jgi:hypothetical protein